MGALVSLFQYFFLVFSFFRRVRSTSHRSPIGTPELWFHVERQRSIDTFFHSIYVTIYSSRLFSLFEVSMIRVLHILDGFEF